MELPYKTLNSKFRDSSFKKKNADQGKIFVLSIVWRKICKGFDISYVGPPFICTEALISPAVAKGMLIHSSAHSPAFPVLAPGTCSIHLSKLKSTGFLSLS